MTFAVHTGNNTDEHLKSEHLEKINHRVSVVDKKIKDIHFNEKMMVRKYEGHYESIIFIIKRRNLIIKV